MAKNEDKLVQADGIMQTFFKLYGPYAFGVASLLLIWFTIVKPELRQQQMDFEAQTEILEKMDERDDNQREIARSMRSTAESLKTTASILDKTVDKLEKMRDQ